MRFGWIVIQKEIPALKLIEILNPCTVYGNYGAHETHGTQTDGIHGTQPDVLAFTVDMCSGLFLMHLFKKPRFSTWNKCVARLSFVVFHK